MHMHKPNNIGLPCGPQSGLVMLDIDTDNEEIIKAIFSVLPKSPWVRIGQKGMVMAYKFNNTQSRKIVSEDEGMIAEIISTGGQVVLPPSIHPKTQAPYNQNCNLYEVLDDLPMMPENIDEKLRDAISSVVKLKEGGSFGNKFKGIEFVSAGNRDNQMNRYAGLLAHEVLRGQITVKRALDEMRSWFDEKVQDIDGDSIDVNKGLGQIIQYIIRDVTNKGKILPPDWDEGLTDAEKEEWGLNFDKDQEEWTFDQIMDEIYRTYETFGPTDPKRLSFEQQIIDKLAKSSKLDTLAISKILHQLKAQSGLSIADYRRRLKEAQAGPIEGMSHTEIAQATIKEMEEKHGQLAFHEGSLWTWAGSHWEPLDEQIARSFIQREFGELALGKRFTDHKQIVNVMKDLVPQTIKTDQLTTGINFANGFLDKELDKHEHDPKFGMTYTLPFCYRPDLAGKCPEFLRFLQDSWGKDPDYQDKCQALREAICTTLFGLSTSYQKCFLLYGAPNSGKSVMMNIIGAMVPDIARVAISPDKWGERFMPARFSGKLLNVAGELHENKYMDGKVFKEIISGEEITAEDKNKDPFKFRPKAAHWFASNYLPKSRDASGGFNRRWLIFCFNHIVPEEDVIVDLDKIIIEDEIEAIVSWALKAFPEFKKRNHYTLPESHLQKIDELAMQNSTVRQWMSERLVEKPGNVIKEKDLYDDYWAFSTVTLSSKVIPPKTFSLQLNQFLAEQRKKQAFLVDGLMSYIDIDLRPEK